MTMMMNLIILDDDQFVREKWIFWSKFHNMHQLIWNQNEINIHSKYEKMEHMDLDQVI